MKKAIIFILLFVTFSAAQESLSLTDAIAIAFLIGNSNNPRVRPSVGTSESNLILTSDTPEMDLTASLASFSIFDFNGQAGVVSMILKLTVPLSIFTSRIIFNETRSLCNSGS